jgi:DNA-directed RNA polymerase specialized sigma subunit
VIVIEMDRKLRSNIANYILGNTRELQFVGNPLLLATLHEVTQASRELLECLRRDSSETEIAESIGRKKTAVRRWENLTGSKWDL